MTTEPSGREDLAGLLERLLHKYVSFYDAGYGETLTNPDGPQAHAAIIKLEQEIAKLRGEKSINAWTAVKEGRYQGSSDAWSVSCVANSRGNAKSRLMAQTGETWSALRGAGFSVVKCTVKIHRAAEALRADGEG